MIEYQLHHTREIVRRSVLAHFRRRITLQDRILFLILIVSLVVVWILGFPDWAVYLLLGLTILALAIPIALYLLWIREGYEKVDALRREPAILRLGDNSLEIEASGVKSKMLWKKVIEMTESDEFCQIYFDHRSFITLPKNDIGTEGLSFLKEKMNDVPRSDA